MITFLVELLGQLANVSATKLVDFGVLDAATNLVRWHREEKSIAIGRRQLIDPLGAKKEGIVGRQLRPHLTN
jgi:hypothetical protein